MELLFIFCAIFCSTVATDLSVLPQIFTNPDGDVVASQYANYFVSAILPSNISYGFSCFWKWSVPGYSFQQYFYVFVNWSMLCYTIPAEKFRIDCEKNETVLQTELTLYIPLSPGNLTVQLICEQNQTVIVEKKAEIRNCSGKNLFTDISVRPISQVYKEKSQLLCEGGRVFHSDGMELLDSSSSIQCLVDTSWSEYDKNLECWKVPSPVNISEFSTVIAGKRLSMNCTYDDVYPLGNETQFFIGDVSYNVTKGDVFTTPILSRSDNYKIVFCQAVTPYTKAVREGGKSAARMLDVQYLPFQTDDQVAASSCSWLINTHQSCEIKFYSNPPATLVSLTRNGVPISNDAKTIFTQTRDEQIFIFEKKNVTDYHIGSYELNLSTSSFPNSQPKILFNITLKIQTVIDIFFEDEVSTVSTLNLGAIVGIGLTLPVAVLVMMLLLSTFLFVRYIDSKTALGKKMSNYPGWKAGTGDTTFLTGKEEAYRETHDAEDDFGVTSQNTHDNRSQTDDLSNRTANDVVWVLLSELVEEVCDQEHEQQGCVLETAKEKTVQEEYQGEEKLNSDKEKST